MHWILTQPHRAVRQMDILTVLQDCDWEVKHIPGVENQIADALSRHPDFQRERCNLLALEVTAAGEWVDDIKAGIIDDESFGPIAHCLANPSPHPLPSTASTKEFKVWVAAHRFGLEENVLLWLCGDLEKTQGNKTARAKEKEEDGNADMRGRLCIPRTMQLQILHGAHDTPEVGNFGSDRTYLAMKDQYLWNRMWHDTQRYVPGCDLCHRTTHRGGKPMRLLQPLPIARGRWQRIGIDFITNLPISGNGHNCIIMFVEHMTNEAHWRACKIIIDAPAFAHMFIDDLVGIHRVPQAVVSYRNIRFTPDYWREVARILQTKLLISTAFHSETDGLTENSNKTVVHYLRGFTTNDQANWDDCLPLAEYAHNSSVHCSMKQTPSELDLCNEPPWPLDLISDAQQPQDDESVKT